MPDPLERDLFPSPGAHQMLDQDPELRDGRRSLTGFVGFVGCEIDIISQNPREVMRNVEIVRKPRMQLPSPADDLLPVGLGDFRGRIAGRLGRLKYVLQQCGSGLWIIW